MYSTQFTRHVIIKQEKGTLHYLKPMIYQDMKEHQKWTTEPAQADRFLNPEHAGRYAKRMLGHDNFRVEPV